MFEMLFPDKGPGMEMPVLSLVFSCLQGLFDGYDDVINQQNEAAVASKKQLTLTIIKKYLVFLI